MNQNFRKSIGTATMFRKRTGGSLMQKKSVSDAGSSAAAPAFPTEYLNRMNDTNGPRQSLDQMAATR